MRLQLVSETESTPVTLSPVQLVAPDERLVAHYGETALYYRRLPLYVRAQHDAEWQPLEYCLLGWDGAVDAQGQPLAYDRSLLGVLPGAIPELLMPRTRESNPLRLGGAATFQVRRVPTAQFRAMLRSSRRRGEVQLAQLTLRVLEYGVLGWAGAVCDQHGQPVAYDPDRLGYLPDETVSELWDWLTAGQAQTEAAVGNSTRSSMGSDG